VSLFANATPVSMPKDRTGLLVPLADADVTVDGVRFEAEMTR
jgi:hypothetical protein